MDFVRCLSELHLDPGRTLTWWVSFFLYKYRIFNSCEHVTLISRSVSTLVIQSVCREVIKIDWMRRDVDPQWEKCIIWKDGSVTLWQESACWQHVDVGGFHIQEELCVDVFPLWLLVTSQRLKHSIQKITPCHHAGKGSFHAHKYTTLLVDSHCVRAASFLHMFS